MKPSYKLKLISDDKISKTKKKEDEDLLFSENNFNNIFILVIFSILFLIFITNLFLF